MTLEGTFDLLDFKGVAKNIQRLFSLFAVQKSNGQISFQFFDSVGSPIDTEILSLNKHKKASFGISIINSSPISDSLFISDSYANLIAFANLYSSRISFENASFLIISASFDSILMKDSISKIPGSFKVYTIFDSTIIGRIMDCQVQNILSERDCIFTLKNECFLVQDMKIGLSQKLSISSFSLRAYCRLAGIIQTVKTLKPKRKGVESFHQLNLQFGLR